MQFIWKTIEFSLNGFTNSLISVKQIAAQKIIQTWNLLCGRQPQRDGILGRYSH